MGGRGVIVHHDEGEDGELLLRRQAVRDHADPHLQNRRRRPSPHQDRLQGQRTAASTPHCTARAQGGGRRASNGELWSLPTQKTMSQSTQRCRLHARISAWNSTCAPPPAAAAARLVVAAEARGTQGADDRVRQAAEQSTAGGVTW